MQFSRSRRGCDEFRGAYLEGQGDLVSRVITPITQIVSPIIPIINLVTKSPDPPSIQGLGFRAYKPSISGLGFRLGFRV